MTGRRAGWCEFASETDAAVPGRGLDDVASAALALPARNDVASYAREAFAAVEDVLHAVDDRAFFMPTGDF